MAPSSENRTDGLDFGRLYASQVDSKTSGLSWLSLSENRTDGLDFGCLYASQFDSKTSGLSWLSLDGANQPPLKNTEISIPDGWPELIISGRGAIKYVPF